MSGTDAAIEALGNVIAAYKQRIAELEQLALQQQVKIEELQKAVPDDPAPPPPAG